MKSLGTPRPWPPEMCDELRQHLSRYSWSHQPKTVTDDLFAILDELRGWLNDARPYDKGQHRRDEWSSLIEDVEAAFDLVGSQLMGLIPSAATLRAALDRDLGVDTARRAALAPVLKQVLAELLDPQAPGAGFLDVVDAVRDTTSRTDMIEGKVDVLDAVLRFASRSLSGTSLTLNGIIDNHAWSVELALHKLDGAEMHHREDHDADAGLSEAERLALAKRWIEHQPVPAQHVVWLFYGQARCDWRFTVGACEFYSGPSLVAEMQEVDEVREAGSTYPPAGRQPHNTPPDELIIDNEGGKYLRKATNWPEVEHWVAVRVDLGVGTFPDVVETARDQVRALVALAAFDRGATSWTELNGHKHFVDGFEAGTSMPFEEYGVERRLPEADHTGSWLQDNQAALGSHVVSGPEAHAVVAAASTLAGTIRTTPSIALLEAVRVIETQASVLHVPHWKELVNEFATPGNTLFRAQIGAADAIEAIAHDHELLGHMPELRRLPDEFNTYEDGRRVTNLATAVERLPKVVATVPTYNNNSRVLRHTADDLATPASIAAYVAAQTARDQRLLRRVHRIRNSLTHGGPVNATMVETTSKFIIGNAEHVTGVTLRALLDGETPTDTLRKYRDETKTWTANLAKANNVNESLFPGTVSDEKDAVT